MSPEESATNAENVETILSTHIVGSAQPGEGSVIDAYHLLHLIGRGGMGEVWLAEQKEPVRRRVALKLIKAGMDTREVVTRFESERQALALMDHPTIAKVFDAGSTPQGRPYFVMEFVTGLPITQYCDRHKLTMRQRLELFMAVCDGVQHAHQKAILHRDLKPSNILVGEVDGKPAPRIIDFGVAKATSQKLTADTMYTRVGMIIGTPGYMSPEQADSAGADVDTRTDVYSLGVVLYELLVGALPQDFRNTTPDEFARRMREEDAPAPSTRLRTTTDETQTTAVNRGADAPTLARELRGDLDAITLKALEKDRARRYATPSELAADVGRYLRNEPILARPASAGYRARKYVRRHRVGVAVGAIAAVLLISVAVAQAVELRRIRRERDRADRVTEFMSGMFKVSDPSEARGNDIKAREILDKASKEIDTGLAKDPELQAQMMHVMGTVYQSLGLYTRAQGLLERAGEIRRRVLGSKNPATLQSTVGLGVVLYQEGRFPEAEKIYRQALEIQRKVLGPEHVDTLKTMNNLADVLDDQGRNADAEKIYREVLEIDRRKFGPENIETLRPLSNLALPLYNEGRYAEAEQLLKQALEINRRVMGPDDPETLKIMGNLGSAYYAERRFAEAEKLDLETIEVKKRVFGPEHQETLRSVGNLAQTLTMENKFEESEKLHRENLAIQQRVLGPEHPESLRSMSEIAEVLRDEGRYAEAEKLQRATIATQQRVLGRENPDTAYSSYNLATIAAGEGKWDEAIAALQEAVNHGLTPGFDLEIEKDAEFKVLRGDSRFQAIVAKARERAAAGQKSK